MSCYLAVLIISPHQLSSVSPNWTARMPTHPRTETLFSFRFQHSSVSYCRASFHGQDLTWVDYSGWNAKVMAVILTVATRASEFLALFGPFKCRRNAKSLTFFYIPWKQCLQWRDWYYQQTEQLSCKGHCWQSRWIVPEGRHANRVSVQNVIHPLLTDLKHQTSIKWVRIAFSIEITFCIEWTVLIMIEWKNHIKTIQRQSVT
jgi:hypothetical protein